MSTIELRRWQHPQVLAGIVSITCLALYVVANPHAPDLAAQVARATVAHSKGVTNWWVGWFGGLQLPSYSVLAPVVVALTGARVAGCAATAVAVLAMTDLLRGTRRHVAGSCCFALFAVSDVAVGRLTFALGFALGLASLAALRRRHWITLVAAAACCLFTLLAAFFLGVAMLAVVIADPSRRRLGITACGCVVAGGLAGQLLFAQTGTMPFSVIGLLGASVTALGVCWLVPSRVVRVGAALMVALPLLVMADPGAIGENIVRLSWLVATPIVVAMAKPTRRCALGAAVLAIAAWPVINTVQQLSSSRSPSTASAFYQPLAHQLAADIPAAGTQAVGQRVEVVPTRGHWETDYLSTNFQLARGWDRQADYADNPLFYKGTLSATTYRQWLDNMAVGWVARPNTALDPAGKAEAALVDTDPPYLHEVWHNPDWTLYRVRQSAPLAVGATVVDVAPTAVTLHFSHPGRATVQMRWMPYLEAIASTGDSGHTACAQPNGTFTSVTASAAGNYILHSDFRIAPTPCT